MWLQSQVVLSRDVSGGEVASYRSPVDVILFLNGLRVARVARSVVRTPIPAVIDRLCRLPLVATTSEPEGAASLVGALRGLLERLEHPVSLEAAGIERDSVVERMEKLVENAGNEATTVVHPRIASMEELERLFLIAHEGREVDF